MKRKALCIVLAFCLIFSTLAVGTVSAVSASTGSSDAQYAQDTIGGGAVLHCFNWTYQNIQSRLDEIKAAGYTAVQTSPVQAPKDYNSSWNDMGNQWWKLYQPLGLSVADGNTWLGTRAQLKSLCDKADEKGIKIIVDVVANHLANNGTDGGTYSYLNSGVETDLKNADYFHTNNTRVNDNSRYNMTQYHLGMPDLNTGNSYVQQKTLSFLKDCVDLGVDGFRFDAAKHIELPNDPSNCKSNFWPTVINGVKSYAQNTYSRDDIFFYGEILGGAGTDISNYTQYMAVTDNYTGDRALDKAYWEAADELADSSYYKGGSASDSVLWVESHDTYMGTSGSAYFQNTYDVAPEVLIKAWAIVASRADSTALYFARPSNTMGSIGNDTNWKSVPVTEINKFKNFFNGTSEYLASSGKVAYNERGTGGVVISKLDGSGSVNLTAHKMKDGTYYDQITNNKFTVSGGKISGTVGDTGVAVVYNPEAQSVDTPYYLRGSFNGWGTDNEMTGTGNTVSTTVNLTAGAYTFKINNENTWYGNEGNIEDSTAATSDNGWEMYDDAGDCTLTASGGTYTFTFNKSTKHLIVLRSGGEATTAPPASSETNTEASETDEASTVDYYLVGYINGADYACNDDWENLGNYKFKNGKLTAKFAQDSYVFVKTGDNSNWYMTDGWQGEVTSTTLYNTNDLNGNGNKLFVPKNTDITFTLTKGNNDTLNLSYKTGIDEETTEVTEAPTTAAPTTAAPTTVAPTTEDPTTIAPTTIAPTTVAPTTQAPEKTYTYYYVPSAEHAAAGYTFKLNINDENGTESENWHQYTMSATNDKVGGVLVYKAVFTARYTKANEIQFQSWDGENWKGQTEIDSTNKINLSDLDGKIVKSDSSVNEYIVDIETTAAPTTVEPTTIAPATVAPATSSTNTVIFSNNKGWSKVNIYAWNSVTGTQNANWPGIAMTKIGTNGYNEDQYTAALDKNFDRIIFNNGSEGEKNQTVNIDYNGSVTGYYLTQQVNNDSNAKWEVGSWTDKPETEAPTEEPTEESTEEPTEAPTEVSTAAPTTAAPTTVAPTTEDPTTIAPTTIAPTTVAPTTQAPEKTYTYYYVPSAEHAAAGYTFKLNINDENGTESENWHQYTMSATNDKVGGVLVYKAVFTARYTKANEIQFQSWDGENWKGQTEIDSTNKINLSDLDGKIVKSDSSVNEYIVDIETTAAPTTVEPTTIAPATAEPTTKPSETTGTYKVILSNNQGWSDVRVYVWKSVTGEYKENWPGTHMDEYGTNDYGETQYIATVNSDYDRIIFNGQKDDGRVQTVDITPTIDGSVTGYYPTSEKDGKWEVGTWLAEPAPTSATSPTEAPTEPATQPSVNPSEYYTTSDGTPVKITDTFTRASDDNAPFSIKDEFMNMQILGVQKKSGNEKRDIRFVAVVNNTILKDADDYGFIAVGASDMAAARSIVESESYNLGNAPAKNVFSCKDKSNRISGDYGKNDSDKPYKYVTFAVNNIGEYAAAVRFYIKDKNGNVFYAPYTNSAGNTYFSCSADWAALGN